MTLTQKETMLLQDLMSHEQMCVDKYGRYAQQANDEQLKTLLTTIGQAESQHLNTLTQIKNGQVPQMQAGGQQQQQEPQFKATYYTESPEREQDKFLCSDLLSTEKQVSSTYDTCIFEFKDTDVRSALNHIQKEEQEHGEKIYKYMAANGMYQAQ